MCAIAGFVGFSDQPLLKKMTRLLEHRGPDAEGTYADELCSLGHRRLSIIDIEGSNQPIYNEDRTKIIVLNGEIYNFREIKTELQRKRHRFYTKGDVEVALHAYEEWGRDCIKRFNGMWSLIIWNKNNKELFISRDRFGIKPLYYLLDGEKIIFASEIKSILEYFNYKKELSLKAIDLFFSFRFVPEHYTGFKNIYKFPKATNGLFKDGKLTTQKYYNLEFDVYQKKQNLLSELKGLLSGSVQYRMIADVPVGSYLSGGLDSSIITKEAKKLNPDLNSFCMSFTDKRYDESHFAEIVSKSVNSKHHVLSSQESDLDLLEKLIWHMDDLCADATIVPTFKLSRYSAKFVKVVLSGDGADEIFAGYEKYKTILFLEKVRNLVKHFPLGFLRGYKYKRFKRYLKGHNFVDRYLAFTNVFTDEEKERLYTKKMAAYVGVNNTKKIVNKYFLQADSPLNKLLNLDQQTWLENDILLKTDKMTMAASLETRVPYLDYMLVNFANNLPSRYKICCFKEKLILRRILQNELPRVISGRRKRGFTVPSKTLKSFAQIYITQEMNSIIGLFNWSFVEDILNSDINDPYRRRQIFCLLYFFVWHKVFFLT